MKKLLFIALLLCATTLNVNAQDVFKEILKTSREVAEDETKDLETRKIATFKYDELCYLAGKVRSDVLRDTTDLAFFNKTITMLNEQSYAMHEFVTLFVSLITHSKKDKDKQVILAKFREASINNPYFYDKDTELVHAYYNNSNYLTQFSLDTDWVKALAEVKK